MVSFAAGALWPLLVVGLIELSPAMVFTDAPANTTTGIGVFASPQQRIRDGAGWPCVHPTLVIRRKW